MCTDYVRTCASKKHPPTISPHWPQTTRGIWMSLGGERPSSQTHTSVMRMPVTKNPCICAVYIQTGLLPRLHAFMLCTYWSLALSPCIHAVYVLVSCWEESTMWLLVGVIHFSCYYNHDYNCVCIVFHIKGNDHVVH